MTAVDNSFKTVVLGDSILWGQGLYEPQKIHVLVIDELTRRGLKVKYSFMAHSGAIIGEPDVVTHMPPIDGEVPVPEPTLFEQIETVLDGKTRDESVNLVMISGGVNDVDITRVLNVRERGVDQYIEDAFCRKMKLLIERAYHCFPNAIIVVTGYYKVFSADSQRNIILNVLRSVGFTVPLLPTELGELVIEVLGPRLTQALIDRSKHFEDYAHECIRESINDLVGMMPEAQDRIFFADPKFKDENAIGASETFLYGVNADFSPQDPAEIAEARAKACIVHADRLNAIEQIAGPRATVGHPNSLGAQQYADVILANLRYALPTLFAAE